MDHEVKFETLDRLVGYRLHIQGAYDKHLPVLQRGQRSTLNPAHDLIG